jgi:hypothetical protein
MSEIETKTLKNTQKHSKTLKNTEKHRKTPQKHRKTIKKRSKNGQKTHMKRFVFFFSPSGSGNFDPSVIEIADFNVFSSETGALKKRFWREKTPKKIRKIERKMRKMREN